MSSLDCFVFRASKWQLILNKYVSIGVVPSFLHLQMMYRSELADQLLFGLCIVTCLNTLYMVVQVLSLIGQNCPHIKSLTLVINGIECVDFFRTDGHKLEELMIHGFIDNRNIFVIRRALKLCPNLKKVTVPGFWIFL